MFSIYLLFFLFISIECIPTNINDIKKCEVNRVVLELEKNIDPILFARERGLTYLGIVANGNIGNYHEYQTPCSTSAKNYASRAVEEDSRVISVLPQVPQQRYGRNNPYDVYAIGRHLLIDRVPDTRSYIPKQWHLMDEDNAASGQILSAWERGYMGQGITVSIIDDGFDRSHPDLTSRYSSSASANYNSGDRSDPTPKGDQSHGTAAGSVAAASGINTPPGSGVCGHGVAPLSTIAGVRLISEPTTDSDEARALTNYIDGVDVYSCSWGPSDDGATLDGPGILTKTAIETGAQSGRRNGNGAIYIWAAGNGGSSNAGDSCAYDGYASHPNVISVGAVTYDGLQAVYSESCPALFICAPSSGAGRSIVAADISGRRGTTAGDCRNDFGGTSAAAPFVAGVASLILSANPSLKSGDVARILATSAHRINTRDSSWTRNAAGIWHSDKYGFGLVDADAAVLLASDYTLSNNEIDTEWKSSPASTCCSSLSIDGTCAYSQAFPCQIPDNSPSTHKLIESCILVDRENSIILERVYAVVSVTHQRRGDVEFKLVSPSGTSSTFVHRRFDRGGEFRQWPLASLKYWGEQSAGKWCLYIEDTYSGNTGQLNTWYLQMYGQIN